jgi:hypothetical protein
MIATLRFCGQLVDRILPENLALMENFQQLRACLLRFHRHAIQADVYPRSFRVALAVGTVLNLINQPEWLFDSASLNVSKALLTYLVPFLVATYVALCERASAGVELGRKHH